MTLAEHRWRNNLYWEISNRLTTNPDDITPATLFMCKEGIKTSTQNFLENFPGRVAYSVKSSPHPTVLGCVSSAGIDDFDVASLSEIRAVHAQIPGARLHFNNPVNTKDEICRAYNEFRVRSFTIDCIEEISKYRELAILDSRISVRIAVPTGSSHYDFSSKFGCGPEQAVPLIREVLGYFGSYNLSFHVGSQCTNFRAYSRALALCRSIANEVGAEPDHVNVGGGFPVLCDGELIDYSDYFAEIRTAACVNQFSTLICEPGRAIVGPSGICALRIRQVSRGRIFLSDGVYGFLGEANHVDRQTTVRVLASTVEDKKIPYQMFGPTCDSFDVLTGTFDLPSGLREGDWLLFDNIGAYSWSLITSFNGFSDRAVVFV